MDFKQMKKLFLLPPGKKNCYFDSLVKQINKEFSVSRDIPGFIANRILMPYLNEAIFALYEGIGTVEDIDKTMKLGTNVPMGPLTLADFIGLDTYVNILQLVYFIYFKCYIMTLKIQNIDLVPS